ncbi:MAG: hypothetical protein E7231_08160 [Cellulosilyticum sp.]|nr:hypothetical protein [Cellulosilyticum sp.]
MKKEYTYCILSLIVFIIGIIFTLSGTLLHTLPDSSKSALLIFSFALMFIGLVSFAVHYKSYITLKKLISNHSVVVARWSYPPNSSDALKKLIKEQKTHTLVTTILILILSIVFFIIFAHSGGPYVLNLGYTLAVLCLLVFIIATRFISTYYEHLSSSEITVLFGENCIYFLDQLYRLDYHFHLLENVNIYIGTENLLIFEYGFDDIDYTCAYSLTIPIPSDRLSTAVHLKEYYRSLIHSE